MIEKDISERQKIFNPKEYCEYCKNKGDYATCCDCYYYDQDYTASNFEERT